jgi:addiction module HigA family antidote
MAGDRPGFRPVHPGVIVKDNIDALGITIDAFAEHIGVSRQTVHAVISGRSSVTAEMAVRLGRAFNTSSRVWLNLQSNHDVWEPEQDAVLTRIRPYKRVPTKRGARSNPISNKRDAALHKRKGERATMRKRAQRAEAAN